MNVHKLSEAFQAWMTTVAEAMLAALGSLRSPRRVCMVEEEVGCLRVEAGADGAGERVRLRDGEFVDAVPARLAAALKRSGVELRLAPGRFVFRPLELPARAIEFLDGIVRAQIDRLTPWSATDAVYGWTPPRPIEKDRIGVTVAASARALMAPYVQAFTQLGAPAVVLAVPSGSELQPDTITVLEHRPRGTLDVRQLRRVLKAMLIAAGLAALVAVAADQWVGADLDAQQQEIARRVAERRSALRRDGAGAAPGQQLLERRKQQMAASVMVIDALSAILPDHTYVTELRVEGDRLQIVGMTQDAPSLIRLMEQSPHFTRATFFAPTTRAPGEAGERFHIEARLNAVFTRT